MSTALALLLAASSLESAELPEPIATRIASMHEDCQRVSGRTGTADRLISRPDVNGDGAADYVVEWDRYACSGAVSLFAGTSATGRPITVYLAERGSAEEVWSGGVGNLMIERGGKRDVLRFEAVCDTPKSAPVALYRWCPGSLQRNPSTGRWSWVRAK